MEAANVAEEFAFHGEVFTGVGKGAYYVGNPGYASSFRSELGYTPYPGTLNLKLSSAPEIKARKTLREGTGIRIPGFTVNGEGFSSLTCYNGTLSGTPVTLLVIDVTHYDDSVMELISPEYLRGKHRLKDGDTVEVNIRR
jgi:riboflavin kinase